MTQIEHILKRPGMYIGGVEQITKSNWIYDKNTILKKEITYSPGLFKIFDELIVNAFDQGTRDITLRNIKISINQTTNEIIVFNDGIGIDVVMHPKEKMYVPELIFGHLLTSTSFDDKAIKTTGGIHGLGAKLTAIFSSYFKVEIGDPINKKSFKQIYKNNLSKRSKPIIKDYNKPIGYVKITFIPDLIYFKIERLNNNVISMMHRRVYDLSALTRPNIKVYLDNKKLNIKQPSEYVSMITKSKQVSLKCDSDRWKIIVTNSINDFDHISFVNGINTLNGGFHVNYIVNQIIKQIKEYVQKKFKTNKIKDSFIKNNILIYMSSMIDNPTFSSQTKDELMTPVNKFGTSCAISPKYIKKMYQELNLDFIISKQIDILQKHEIKKTDVKRKSNIVGIPKLYDANYAGTSKSKECSLILTEGDSAKTMAVSGLGIIPKATNYYGVFPLKGKLINVRDLPHKRIIKNTEFINIKNIIGLRQDKKYTIDNISELRYGSIILMMDADVDGSHIKGLFINMIHYFWPSLLEIEGFIKIFITPIVKVSHKDKVFVFYNGDDYHKWKKKHDTNKFKIKYYKGLGTNTSKEAKEYFSKLDDHIIKLKREYPKTDSIELAFSKSMTEERKLWLKKYDPSNNVDYKTKTLSYDDFINKELIHFSNYDNIRSIPNIIDGLKPSHRKVLYASFKRNLLNEIKVAQFVGYIGEHTSYHHGEVSLANTIIGMAQNFIGSNNVNLLEPKGQFGTRIMGGKDHSSPRYIFTQLNKITRLIFRKEDDEILDYLDDDGTKIEPKFYVPIIPTILVNGSEGIGTGYSTYIPKFNIKTIFDYIKSKLRETKVPKLEPWYNGFGGKIIKLSNDVYITKGVFERDGKKIIITELPIGTWTEKYRNYVTNLMNDNQFIRSIKHNSTDATVDITITFKDEESINNLLVDESKYVSKLEKFFSLTSVINLSNMHAYDDKLNIKKFKYPDQIVKTYFKVRLEFYEKRKAYILAKLKRELQILDAKVKFINMIIKGDINIFNVPINQLNNILSKKKIYKFDKENPYDYLTKMPLQILTLEKVKELNDMYKSKKKARDTLKKKTINELWLDDLKDLELFMTKL